MQSIKEILKRRMMHTTNREMEIEKALEEIESLLEYSMIDYCCSFQKQATGGISNERLRAYIRSIVALKAR